MQIPFLSRGSNRTQERPSCHGGSQADTTGLPLVAIVGCPNVGKSVLFNALTGAYVTVSNYPGTTVEVARGKGRLGSMEIGVVDTPGMYRLLPLTEDERVAREILLRERPDVVVHVADAKNLERMLPMTLQLIEAGLPVILDLNLMDEAERQGVQVDVAALERALGVPVVGTALALGWGTAQLKEQIAACVNGHLADGLRTSPQETIEYPLVIEEALEVIEVQLDGNGAYQMTNRAIALLLLQNDAEVASLVREQAGRRADELLHIAETTRARFSRPISYIVARRQQKAARRIFQSALTLPEQRISGFAERLSEAMMNPLTGIPILLLAIFMFGLLTTREEPSASDSRYNRAKWRGSIPAIWR